jgi:arylsulfatase A-like enzyme
MSSRWIAFKTAALVSAVFLGLFESAGAARPSFVIILADDMGYGDPGYHGGKAKTPNLDKLAAEGVKLEAHYVHPMCSPTRAALLTGRYASRFGVTAAQNEQALPFGTPTMASVLAAAGYDTALTGKWHLGSTPATGPGKFGFGHSYGCLAGGCTPDTHQYKTGPFQSTWHRNGELIEEEGHVTDLITREAVNWIGGRADKPFLLYVPFTAVHVPIAEPERWMKVNAHIEDAGQRLFAADMSHLDDCVGQIIAALENKGLRDNTLLLFLSDNGAHPPVSDKEPNYSGAEGRPDIKVGGINTPLRGFKTQVYEGGIRTPAIAHWPSRWKPATISRPISVTDWLPTFCALAGVAADGQKLKLDGRELTPLLSGVIPESAFDPHPIYSVSPSFKARMVRRGPWKLVETGGKDGKQGAELFNIEADIGESDNRYLAEPTIAQELGALLERFAANDRTAVTPGVKVKTKE